MAACGHHPFVQDDLPRPDPCCAPFGIGQKALDRLDVEIEGLAVHGHRVFHTHDKLHVERRFQPTIAGHFRRLMDMAEVETLDLGFHIMFHHLGSQPVDQIWRVLVDAAGEVVRPDRKRGHIGSQWQHAAACLACPRPPAGRELDDHTGAMLFQTFLEACEFLGVGRRRAVIVADMRVADGGACLVSFLCAFNLLRHRDRYCGVIGLGWHRACDSDADDARFGHGQDFPVARDLIDTAT